MPSVVVFVLSEAATCTTHVHIRIAPDGMNKGNQDQGERVDVVRILNRVFFKSRKLLGLRAGTLIEPHILRYRYDTQKEMRGGSGRTYQ